MHTHVRLIMIATILLLLGRIPQLQQSRRDLDQQFLLFQGFLSLQLQEQHDRLRQTISPFDRSHLQLLEQTNRSLQSRVQLLEQQVRLDERRVQLASESTTRKHITAILTRTLEQWVVLAGSEDGVRGGDIVTESGAYIGEITSVFPTWSLMRSIADRDFSLTVMIGGGGEGVLRSGADTLILRTVDTIGSAGSASAVLTIPNPSFRGEQYPIGITLVEERREEILTTRRVRPIGQLAVGQLVIVRGAEQ